MSMMLWDINRQRTCQRPIIPATTTGKRRMAMKLKKWVGKAMLWLVGLGLLGGLAMDNGLLETAALFVFVLGVCAFVVKAVDIILEGED